MEKNNLRKLKRLGLTLNQSVEIDHQNKRQVAQFREALRTYESTKRRTDNAAAVELQAFIEVGEMLSAIKSRLRKGLWGKWVETNLGKNLNTASRWMRAAMWARANSPSLESCTVAMLMRLCGDNRQPLVHQQASFVLTLDRALQWLKPTDRLTIEDVLNLPLPEQLQLRTSLEHVHALYLALPIPSNASAQSYQQPQSIPIGPTTPPGRQSSTPALLAGNNLHP